METRTAQLVRSAGARIVTGLRAWNQPLVLSPGRRWPRWITWALANAARHAPGAPVRLVLRRDGPAVRLQVENGPPPGPPGEPGPPGHGITGMSERARAEGGELTIVRSPDGRFAVEALLPLGVRA